MNDKNLNKNSESQNNSKKDENENLQNKDIRFKINIPPKKKNDKK